MELTPAHLRYLLAIYEVSQTHLDISSRSIAEKLGVTKPSVVRVLNLLMDLQEKSKVAYMFVTHDLSVVRHISDNICVMYLGQLVEKAPSRELFAHTLHPYTKALLSAIPSTDILHPMKRLPLKGEITSPINPKPGCRFYSRCPYAKEACREPQQLTMVSDRHFVSCCRVAEINTL